MTMIRDRFTCPQGASTAIVFLFVATMLSGCRPAVTAVPADDHSEHDHEAEHLEHFVPAHKPRDFETLVQQLAERIASLAAAATEGSAETVELQRRELSDVIGWIPELAADSELRKQDFEKVRNAGLKLRAEFDEQFGPGKSRAPDVSGFEPMLAELEQLIPASKENSRSRL